MGTNTKVEVLALWGLLWLASHLYMDKIWIIRDSKVLIDHMNHKAIINLGSMVHWLERINLLKSTFSEISFHHVYREKNDIADQLEGNFGKMYYQLQKADGYGASGTVNLI